MYMGQLIELNKFGAFSGRFDSIGRIIRKVLYLSRVIFVNESESRIIVGLINNIKFFFSRESTLFLKKMTNNRDIS